MCSIDRSSLRIKSKAAVVSLTISINFERWARKGVGTELIITFASPRDSRWLVSHSIYLILHSGLNLKNDQFISIDFSYGVYVCVRLEIATMLSARRLHRNSLYAMNISAIVFLANVSGSDLKTIRKIRRSIAS